MLSEFPDATQGLLFCLEFSATNTQPRSDWSRDQYGGCFKKRAWPKSISQFTKRTINFEKLFSLDFAQQQGLEISSLIINCSCHENNSFGLLPPYLGTSINTSLTFYRLNLTQHFYPHAELAVYFATQVGGRGRLVEPLPRACSK